MSSSSAEVFDKARVCHQRGQFAEALVLFDALIQHHADVPEVQAGRGDVLISMKSPAPALACYDKAIALRPAEPRYHVKKGVALQLLGRLDDALQSYDQAITLDATGADAHYNKGTVLAAMERLDEAAASYDEALRLRPGFAQAWSNKGVALQALKRPTQALVCFDRAIALMPANNVMRRNKAFCSLLLGQFEEGWRLYEERPGHPLRASAVTDKRLWSGEEDLTGKTLLVHGEQGLGDVIQFCRYAALAEAQGARVTLAAPAALVRLLGQSGLRVVDEHASAGDFDFHIALLSMPLVFRTDAKTIPAVLPYLAAEPDRVAVWSQKLGPQGFRIGIAWQGDKARNVDAGRSIPLRHFASLADIPGVRLISLQKNYGTEQLAHLPDGMAVDVLGEAFDAGPDAFVDSAAVMESLDLVITSDTAIAHLAGALGRPVWLALQHVPEWRWQLDRDDSPWYPGMRLFRQQTRGDWSTVFAQMQAELTAMVRAAS